MTPVYDPILGRLRNSEVDKSEVRSIVEQLVNEKLDTLKHKYVESEEKMYLDGAGPQDE